MGNNKKNKFDLAEGILQKHYDFRINLVTCRADFKKKKEKEFSVLDDMEMNSILRLLRKSIPAFTKQNLQQIVSSDFSNRYDPIKDYFKHLPAHDETQDYISELASTITVENQSFWENCLRKWLVGLVANVLKNEIVNDQTIILSSTQGLGKTRWIEKLVPKELKPYFYSGHIDPKNKDSQFLLTECFLIDMDEMVGLTPAKNEALKHLLTKNTIKVRRQYDTYHNNYVRRANFIASTNKARFLQDPSGSRRFMCFTPTIINYTHEIDMSKVFSQAKHLLQSGYQYWLNEQERAENNINNKKYEFLTQIEIDIIENYTSSSKAKNGIFLTTTEIAIELFGMERSNPDHSLTNRIGKALIKHGFEPRKKGHQHGYYIDRLNDL